MSGTSVVSGLSSGIDWRNVLEQLKKLEHKRIDLIEQRKTTYENRLSAWQSITSKLLALKTKANTINRTAHFNLYTTSLSSDTTTNAEDILSVVTSTDAAPGTYEIKVNSLARAEKLSSTTFSSQTTALGLSGDLIIGGRTVKIFSTDTLQGIRDKINAVNTGTNASKVTASIVNYGVEGYRLILTSDEEGKEGISLLNGGGTDLVGLLGLRDASDKTAKNTVANGNKSDAFAYADRAVGGSDLLNLTNPESGYVSITIDGVTRSVSIDLETDSLNDIRDAINAAFSGEFTSDPASVVSETVNGATRYRLLIEGGTIAYTDASNILETLGILERAGVSDEIGVTGDVANTSRGIAITSSTLVKDIDGYNDYASGDKIVFTGFDTDGNAVNYEFTINDTTTVGDLLDAIEAQYGDVTASITADGRIRVIDNEIGDHDLCVILTPSSSRLSFDSDNDFGSVSTIRKRQIQAGADASLTVDGVSVTSASNTVNDVIPGVTLNLKKADSATTVTLTIKRDYDAVKESIVEFINSYNEVIDAINSHLSFDSTSETAGGVLFGDSTLRSIKNSLVDIIVEKVSGVDEDFSTLGLIGINISNDGKLTIDEDDLEEYLETNFDDVKRLFAFDWSSTNSSVTYLSHSIDTQSGTYNINITGTNPVSGYFETEGDATGYGEFLKGISGNVEGLLVRYSGTETGCVGTITLTFGVAELIDRALYHITDSVDGTVANKKETIQNTIDRLNERIQWMEDRLDRKMTMLERQFIAMETALSTLQSQINWLTGQINASYRGWK